MTTIVSYLFVAAAAVHSVWILLLACSSLVAKKKKRLMLDRQQELSPPPLPPLLLPPRLELLSLFCISPDDGGSIIPPQCVSAFLDGFNLKVWTKVGERGTSATHATTQQKKIGKNE